MRATGFTHVSVHAHDLEESVRFYKDLFGMEEIPAPGFPFSVRWLRVGDLQLHLFQSEDPAPQGHHFGIKVNEFEDTYIRLKRTGARRPDRVPLLLKRLRAAGRGGPDLDTRHRRQHVTWSRSTGPTSLHSTAP